jgi:hypothetical protein
MGEEAVGDTGQIRTTSGRADKFEARVNYRDFDGRTMQVTAWGKTKTEAANSLGSILKEGVKPGGSEGLKSSDRVSVAAALFMVTLKALFDACSHPVRTTPIGDIWIRTCFLASGRSGSRARQSR